MKIQAIALKAMPDSSLVIFGGAGRHRRFCRRILIRRDELPEYHLALIKESAARILCFIQGAVRPLLPLRAIHPRGYLSNDDGGGYWVAKAKQDKTGNRKKDMAKDPGILANTAGADPALLVTVGVPVRPVSLSIGAVATLLTTLKAKPHAVPHRWKWSISMNDLDRCHNMTDIVISEEAFTIPRTPAERTRYVREAYNYIAHDGEMKKRARLGKKPYKRFLEELLSFSHFCAWRYEGRQDVLTNGASTFAMFFCQVE